MRYAALVLLALPPFAYGARHDAPDFVRSRLLDVAGREPVSCGEVPLGDKRTEAIACAREASRSGKAFWVAFQLQSTDSYLWEGAAGDGRGGYWRIFYDSDITGGGGGESLYSFSQCLRLQFRRFGESVVKCSEMRDED